MRPARRQGFSMIELLIVLVILAVLAAQVVPGFQQHVIRARRSEAQAALLQLMQQEERFFTQANTYIAFSSTITEPEARQFKWWSSNGAPTSAYEIEGKACDGELISQCVQLIATPGTALVDASFRDDDCRQLKLTSSGLRLATGPSVHCWP
ncbi:type IV pilin protein [Duganella violaceipulchra]|uniref:Type IV pilin protein n=2 Tax=Duganella violaceipulchra TaxID=2849652 RepID=A0AA41HGI4_9BURK|nr:type IV pilin protein [Duganella violaceicalia]MBV6324677.1 type IV pilin protein [Duganella violaceicalia]